VTKAELQKWKAQLQEADCAVLPTTSDQWVTLGNDVGFVCVCDDEKISKEFAENSESVHFLCLNMSGATASISSSSDRCSHVKRFYAYLGVPLLSQVGYGCFDYVCMML